MQRIIEIKGTFEKMGGTITDPIATIKRVSVQFASLNEPRDHKPCLVVELQYSAALGEKEVQVDSSRLPKGIAIPEIWKSDQPIVGGTWADAIHNAVAAGIESTCGTSATVRVISE
jgi:hypothetical protein